MKHTFATCCAWRHRHPGARRVLARRRHRRASGTQPQDLMLLGVGMTTLAIDKARPFELGDRNHLPSSPQTSSMKALLWATTAPATPARWSLATRSGALR